MEDRALNDPLQPAERSRPLLLLVALLPFVVLATMNSSMYRYGASDQAFYIPAVVLAMHPDHFPRDAPLILAQARLMFADEVLGTLSSATGIGLAALAAALYVGTLVLLAVATWLIAARLYRSPWTGLALLAALTLRHAISRTATNTLEGYFHPRQLAFAIGALAIALILRRRTVPALLAILVAGAIHPTTAMWFAIWLIVAVLVSEPRWRIAVAAAVAGAGLAAGWALTAGPLTGRLVVMDETWLAALDTKNYLFPLGWPLSTWVLNLLYLPVIALIYRWRRKEALVEPPESGVVLGAFALVAVFATMLPLNAAHVALAVQLQVSRVFWMLDFLATIYLVWALAEGGATLTKSSRAAAPPSRMRARLVLVVLVCLAAVRGGYSKFVSSPERPIAQIDIPDNDWGRAMAWARATDVRSHWLADPIHAARYGMSLRMAGERDLFVEAIKDEAIGIYDRNIALRTRARLTELGDFAALTAERARMLAVNHELDYLLAERPFDLPLAFQSGSLRIYRLR